jgi:hypothetical protein
MTATLTDEQKRVLEQRLHDLISEIVRLTSTNKEIMRIFEQLYKLKFRFEHDAQINQIAPQALDRKAIKEELNSLLQ